MLDDVGVRMGGLDDSNTIRRYCVRNQPIDPWLPPGVAHQQNQVAAVNPVHVGTNARGEAANPVFVIGLMLLFIP